MVSIKKVNGYKPAVNYIKEGTVLINIVAEPKIVYGYNKVEKKRTEEITGYKYSFTFEGATEVFEVKVETKLDIKQFDHVIAENLEVFENFQDGKAYFRMSGAKKVSSYE